MVTKVCGRCGQDKPLGEFYFKNQVKGTRQSYCKGCFSERHKGYYQSNKTYYIDKKNRIRGELVEEVRKRKDQPCTDCGQRFPYFVMDFDHRDGKLKVGGIAELVSRGQKAKVLAEISKCDVVCANCHRIRTHQRMVGIA